MDQQQYFLGRVVVVEELTLVDLGKEHYTYLRCLRYMQRSCFNIQHSSHLHIIIAIFFGGK